MKGLKAGLIALLVLGSAAALADWSPGDPHKMHYPQLPDPNGWDVRFHDWQLADDWQCSQTGPVDDIHIWVSYKGENGQDPPWTVLNPTVMIYSDIPAGQSPTGYSMPGTPLWQLGSTYNIVTRYESAGMQGWYDPAEPAWIPNDHSSFFQINITGIENPFVQQQGTIYWLGIGGMPLAQPEIGWKSTQDAFNDAAVWQSGGAAPWSKLTHPAGQNMDLAFVITPEPTTSALIVGVVAVWAAKRRLRL